MNMMIRIRMIGEISSPPRLGMKERIGASAGSVIRYRNSATAETNPLRVFTTLKAISQDRIAEAINSQIYRSRTMRTMSRTARMADGLWLRSDPQARYRFRHRQTRELPGKRRGKRPFSPFLTWHWRGL